MDNSLDNSNNNYNAYQFNCGVQQGDPLGPLGFALALHPIVRTIQHQSPVS